MSTVELLKLYCKIVIGKFEITYVNEVSINSNIENLTDTCTITLPRALFFEGKPIKEHLKRNDKVHVELGYNDQLNTIFNGYIKNLKTGTPLIIECEDEMFALKQLIVKPKYYKKTSLNQLLSEYLPKNIKSHILDFDLGEFRIQDETNLAKILSYITSKYMIRFFFKTGEFYATMPHTQILSEGNMKKHVFDFQKNIISDSIQYQYKDDINITVVCKSIQKDNSEIEVREPKGGDSEIRTYYYNNKTKAELEKIAKDNLKYFKYDGLNGNFKAFGIPFVQVSDAVTLIDKNNEERNNKTYLVKAVKYNFGIRGYRQNIELSYKL